MEAWTGEEDTRLLKLIEQHGPSWSVIEESFPTRTVASIRNRYQRILRGRREPGRNRCLRCGQLKRGHTCTAARFPELPPFASPCILERMEETEEDAAPPVPSRALSWYTVATVHAMGFEDVTHPSLAVQHFPFETSLPSLE